MTSPVFHDPSGRRAKAVGGLIGLLLAGVLLAVGLFVANFALSPKLPRIDFSDPLALTALQVGHHAAVKEKAWKPIHAPRNIKGQRVRPLSVGFYVSWDEESRQSLRDHVNQLDVVAPQWVQLAGGDGRVQVTNDYQATGLIAASTRKPAVMPLVFNAQDQTWQGPVADALLANPRARQALVSSLVDLAKSRGYAGFILDFEDLSGPGLAAYPSFVAQARAALHANGRELWVTAPFADDAWPTAQIGRLADAVVLMAYDEHWSTGDAGPLASQGWFQQGLADALKRLDPNKVIVALGSYGYDWPKGKTAEAVSFHEAVLTSKEAGAPIAFDRAALEPTYGYADDQGVAHTVWFLDAPAVFNQVRTADAWRPRGYGLWRLGSEDPGVWSLFGKPYGQAGTAALQTIPGSQDVDFDGTGEILNVIATPTPGRRTLQQQPGSGFIVGETYEVIPTAYDVQRVGAKPGWVALTFDDGPDPKWTARILDVLKQKQVPASFFVIGENMEAHPDLVEREVAEGHLVGNHTFTHPNVAEIRPRTLDVELNLNQRLFQTLTGRSLRFFRPPYFGDAEPSTAAEVRPLIQSGQLGYLTAGLRIDPNDWQRPPPEVIAQRVIDRLADPNPETGGQVVLLHDSGGDRSRTLQALPGLIDQLKAKGYRFTTVAGLAGLTPAQAMPPADLTPEQLWVNRLAFTAVRTFDRAVNFLFLSAITLGLMRLIVLGVLALAHRARIERRTPPDMDPTTGPLVSVLIPCFNEEKVIVSSVERILASSWPRLDVIVLDDGSSDATAARVREAFGDHPTVRLLSFENGGKARALNRGLKAARGEIIIALDADTLFPPETIGRLARWFVDDEVGAVAGNALVGNRINTITRWQALEYVTAQNLERRALAALGAVTVVPGAVGAWRRAALDEVGGFPDDTLAEDQDLTLSVQQHGWKVEFDPEARAFTEAPDTIRGLLKQRFRWSFGTLQCVWKHRSGLFDRKHPALGFVAMPQIWLFQIFLTLVAPLVDLAVIYSLVRGISDRVAHPAEWNADALWRPLAYWAAFVLFDLSAAAIGMALEKRAPWKSLPWLPVQRFGYRQLMYYVVIRAVATAVQGPRVGWGKLERRASAVIDAPRHN